MGIMGIELIILQLSAHVYRRSFDININREDSAVFFPIEQFANIL